MPDKFTRKIPILILALLIAGLALASLGEAWSIGHWSVEYLSREMSVSLDRTELPPVPERHQRASIWLAQDAIRAGEPARALSLLEPSLQSGEVLAESAQGQALAAAGEFEAAIEYWVRAGDYQSLVQTASELASSGQLEEAELAYRSAWGINPLDGTLPLVNFLWHVRNEPSAAEHILRQSLVAYQSSNLNWIRALGNVLRAQERWGEALVFYDLALELKPDDMYTLQLIGEVYMFGEKDFESAFKIFYDLVEKAPDQGIGYFELGQLMTEMGRYDEADHWFEQAIARKPDEPWWWVVRANSAREAQYLASALDFYNQAALKDPGYALAYYEMAWTYKLDDQPEQATWAIEQALELRKIPSVWYYLRAGAIYEWAGDEDRAINAYEQALEIAPTNQQAQDALQRLTADGL